ncbi:hypothetical protein TNCV_34921 [Trichonephila clavipes]|nr:hypothetical protein TNCV_34921 [Trichonephila clavipes]
MPLNRVMSQNEAHKIHRSTGLVFTPVVDRNFEIHTGDIRFGSVPPPIFRARTLKGGTPSSREDFRLNEYLEFSHAAKALYIHKHPCHP